jgi:nucleoside-diphosphate-sugar epimerase
MAILITGSGLVGTQIARLELERGETPVLMDIAFRKATLARLVDLNRVRLFEGDILNPWSLAKVIRDEKITRVIHTAAFPLLTIGAQQKPYAAIQVNIMGTVNILEAARVFELERVVCCSSSVLYGFMMGGEDLGAEFKEEAYPRPTTIYATTKQTCENLGINYTYLGIDFVAVRFGGVFGPWEGTGGGGPSVVFREMLEKSLRGEEAGFPNRRAEWLYSKDAAQGAVKACHAENLKSRVFNIGGGKAYDSQEVVDAVKRLIPQAKVKLVEPLKFGGPPPKSFNQPMDLTRARSELNYEPEFPIEKAVEDFIGFLKAK